MSSGQFPHVCPASLTSLEHRSLRRGIRLATRAKENGPTRAFGFLSVPTLLLRTAVSIALAASCVQQVAGLCSGLVSVRRRSGRSASGPAFAAAASPQTERVRPLPRPSRTCAIPSRSRAGHGSTGTHSVWAAPVVSTETLNRRKDLIGTARPPFAAPLQTAQSRLVVTGVLSMPALGAATVKSRVERVSRPSRQVICGGGIPSWSPLGCSAEDNCGAQSTSTWANMPRRCPGELPRGSTAYRVQPKVPTRRSVLRGQDLGDDRHSQACHAQRKRRRSLRTAHAVRRS